MRLVVLILSIMIVIGCHGKEADSPRVCEPLRGVAVYPYGKVNALPFCPLGYGPMEITGIVDIPSDSLLAGIINDHTLQVFYLCKCH
jgi:hypothetical protein